MVQFKTCHESSEAVRERILVDYHIHTRFSDGLDTLEDCLAVAVKKGLDEIAFTDHVWRSSNWVDLYVNEIELLRKKHPQIKIYAGLEAKAINLRGELDVTEEDADKVDFIMGSVHRMLPEENNTRYRDLANLDPREAPRLEADLMAALADNPLVSVIAHPMRLYYKFFYPARTSKKFPDELLLESLAYVKKRQKLIELNFGVPDLEELLVLYFSSGARFVLGSDAHSAQQVGGIPYERIYASCPTK